MLVFTHPACLGHDAGPEHPESPARLEAVLDALRAAFPDLDWREAPLAKLGDLCRVHEREQVDAVLETASKATVSWTWTHAWCPPPAQLPCARQVPASPRWMR